MLRSPSLESRSSGWLRAGATVAISALAITLLSATPAFALPIAQVPANTADWASTPYSPLQPGEIAATGNTKALTFDGTEGGLNASGDVGTGFTMVQPSTADPQWYLPENLCHILGKSCMSLLREMDSVKGKGQRPLRGVRKKDLPESGQFPVILRQFPSFFLVNISITPVP